MKKSGVSKRESVFAKNVKRLNAQWTQYNEFLMLRSVEFGFADMWKYQTYVIQNDAALGLIYSHSNQHPNVGHKVIRRDGQLVISSQVLRKAFYLRYFMLLIQGSGDKLAQMVRCALGIEKWKTRANQPPNNDADEGNTTLVKLAHHLRLTLQESSAFPEQELFNKIYEKIEGYRNDDAVREILAQANALKHRWQLFFQGEGLQPLKPQIEKIKNKQGKTIATRLPIGGYTYGQKIERHIRLCLRVNNLFVEMANGILHDLDFERFYEFRDGKRVLKR